MDNEKKILMAAGADANSFVDNNSGKIPLTNCHTHTFIGESIPPYIAKTMVPWPFYKILTIPFILNVCRFYYLNNLSPYTWQFKPWFKSIVIAFQKWRLAINRNRLLSFLALIINCLIVYHSAIFLMVKLLKAEIIQVNNIFGYLNGYKMKGVNPYFFLLIKDVGWYFVAFTILFIKMGRKILFFIFRKAWGFLAMLPDRKTIDLLGRYINIGRFAYQRSQQLIMSKLEAQYPSGSRFVILPMDMEFMDAGKISQVGNFGIQMQQLADMKEKDPGTIFPFVAIDPRRKQVGTEPFFVWSEAVNGKVKIENCFLKRYIVDKKFKGLKIYPALGYYPFDIALLPLWKYAADNNIPIMTHCIRGSIFYRGNKMIDWDEHPVFMENCGKSKYRKLFLPEVKNVDFTVNFTHPLNYLCLLDERLLRIVVGNSGDPAIKQLFGYTDKENVMTSDLCKLKICLAHYGGKDEWDKYFEKDRDNFANQLQKKPTTGISFFNPGDIATSWGKLELIWKNLDWYSIISSMMLQYENVYADISYIVHDDKIVSLLKATLKNPLLETKVLFGTDFYVVRNHKSERQMLANIQGALTEAEFDQIARVNPRFYV